MYSLLRRVLDGNTERSADALATVEGHCVIVADVPSHAWHAHQPFHHLPSVGSWLLSRRRCFRDQGTGVCQKVELPASDFGVDESLQELADAEASGGPDCVAVAAC